jgi:hypothetical protein
MSMARYLGRHVKIVLAVLGMVAIVVVVVVLVTYVVAQNSQIAAKVWFLIDSNISIAIVSTFAAAFAGTWGAQLVAKRSERRRILLDEIRATKIAVGLAFNIANTYMTYKDQSVRGMCQRYSEQCAARTAHLNGLRDGTIAPNAAFHYERDMETVVPPFSPVEELKRVLLDKIEFGRAHIILTPLLQSIDGMRVALLVRNEWIDTKKTAPQDDVTQRFIDEQYFGVRSHDGRLDRIYPDSVKAIGRLNDSCIGFTLAIIHALDKHGQPLREKYGSQAPKITIPNFAKAEAMGLVPDMALYAAWGQ